MTEGHIDDVLNATGVQVRIARIIKECCRRLIRIVRSGEIERALDECAPLADAARELVEATTPLIGAETADRLLLTCGALVQAVSELVTDDAGDLDAFIGRIEQIGGDAAAEDGWLTATAEGIMTGGNLLAGASFSAIPNDQRDRGGTSSEESLGDTKAILEEIRRVIRRCCARQIALLRCGRPERSMKVCGPILWSAARIVEENVQSLGYVRAYHLGMSMMHLLGLIEEIRCGNVPRKDYAETIHWLERYDRDDDDEHVIPPGSTDGAA